MIGIKFTKNLIISWGSHIMKNIKLVLLLIIVQMTSGCNANSNTLSEKLVAEMCYDGVVYLRHGNPSLSVKFNSDNTVATVLSNGINCKDLK